MGKLMIKCPKTGDAIFTGLTADKERFAAMPVFFGRALCKACGATHEWFARDAWVHDVSDLERMIAPIQPGACASVLSRALVIESGEIGPDK